MDGQKLPEALRHSAVMSAVEPQVRDGREQRAQTLCPTSRTSALRGYERLHERFVLRDVPWAWPWGRDTVAHGPPRPKPTSRSRFRKSCHGLHVLFVRGLHVLFARSKASRHHTQPMAPRRRFAGQRCRMSVLGDQIEARHDSKSHPSRRRSARKTCVGLAGRRALRNATRKRVTSALGLRPDYRGRPPTTASLPARRATHVRLRRPACATESRSRVGPCPGPKSS